MALNDLKQTDAEINQYGVISAPDKMTGSAAENKAVFDRLFRQVGAEKFNQLIDELQASGAAAQIGIATVAGLTGAATVQEAVEKIMSLLREMTQGAVANGSITEPKLADASVSNRTLQSASVNTDNYVDKSITEEKYADASIPERAFRSETVGGDMLKPKSVNTKHYADRSIGNDQLDDLCIGERNMLPGSVGESVVKTGTVSGSVTVTMPAAGWVDNVQTVAAEGVSADHKVIVSATPDSFIAYCEAQVRCIAKDDNALTFRCEDVPTADLNADVVYIKK